MYKTLTCTKYNKKYKFKYGHSLVIYLILPLSVPHLPTIKTVENCMKLFPMVVQGFWDVANPFLQLPHINEDNLKYFLPKKVRLLFCI